MVDGSRQVLIKDSTLREGMDVPGVTFSMEQRATIATMLDRANVPEIEIVAPGKVAQDLEFAKMLKGRQLRVQASGLIYAYTPHCEQQIQQLSECLDRLDLLMPVSTKRKPYSRDDKLRLLLDALDTALPIFSEVGVGFPHSTQAECSFLSDIAQQAVQRGAARVTVYDTNGSSDPFAIHELITILKRDLPAPLFFHAHNDLGMATANSLAAVYAGAQGLDATINGLGDRAGNCSLEQIALSLHLKGYFTGIALEDLFSLSEAVATESGVAVFRIAPVVGEDIFAHKSPAHLDIPELFEAYDPRLVGSKRRLVQD
jgi:homocitrate synthase NifV